MIYLCVWERKRSTNLYILPRKQFNHLLTHLLTHFLSHFLAHPVLASNNVLNFVALILAGMVAFMMPVVSSPGHQKRNHESVVV